MTEWKPGWWARMFMGAGSWALPIGEGRMRVCGIPREVDADVPDILGLAVGQRSRRISITLPHRTEVVLTGLSRRAVREVEADRVLVSVHESARISMSAGRAHMVFTLSCISGSRQDDARSVGRRISPDRDDAAPG